MTRLRLGLLFMLLLTTSLARAESPSQVLMFGQSLVRLDGPWKFHTGDDPRWADPRFDDSAWENVDIGASPEATDGDVGLSHYSPGWNAKGHAGYHGYAWYRLHIKAMPPHGSTLGLLGPWAVDSAYEAFANGTLLGGVGDFSAATPKAYSYHYPRYFELPPDLAGGGSLVLAIRVWMGPWGAASPTAGGMHIAPMLGERSAAKAEYRLQWLKIFEGYVVDTVPALLFLVMAGLALYLWLLDRTDRSYLWLSAALCLSAIVRGNQPFFFWWQIETIRDFVFLIAGFAIPLTLGAWMMAWRAWFKLTNPGWLPTGIAVLTAILILGTLLSYPWAYDVAFPNSMKIGVHYLVLVVRLAFLLTLAFILYLGIRQNRRATLWALPAVLAIGAVLFSRELSAIHVPGIWFPWGVGVSLSEYMSVLFDLLLGFLFLGRLRLYSSIVDARRIAPAPGV